MSKNFLSYKSLSIYYIIFIAFLLRMFGLSEKSLWLDEALNLSISSVSWKEIWFSPLDPTPPLYYSLIKLILNFGDSELFLRLPSVVFSLLTIFLVYKSAFLLSGFKSAIIASQALTLSMYSIEYAQEARTYALLGFLISLAFYGVVKTK